MIFAGDLFIVGLPSLAKRLAVLPDGWDPYCSRTRTPLYATAKNSNSNNNRGSVSYGFRDKQRFQSKNKFSSPYVYLTPSEGVLLATGNWRLDQEKE